MFILPSIWPVLLGAVASMIIGMLWYGPLFLKPWAKAVGIKMPDKPESMKNMQKELISAFASSLVLALGVGMLVLTIGITAVSDLIIFSLIATAAFAVPGIVNQIAFERKGWGLLWISGLYMFTLVVVDALLVYAFDIM